MCGVGDTRPTSTYYVIQYNITAAWTVDGEFLNMYLAALGALGCLGVTFGAPWGTLGCLRVALEMPWGAVLDFQPRDPFSLKTRV